MENKRVTTHSGINTLQWNKINTSYQKSLSYEYLQHSLGGSKDMHTTHKRQSVWVFFWPLKEISSCWLHCWWKLQQKDAPPTLDSTSFAKDGKRFSNGTPRNWSQTQIPGRVWLWDIPQPSHVNDYQQDQKGKHSGISLICGTKNRKCFPNLVDFSFAPTLHFLYFHLLSWRWQQWQLVDTTTDLLWEV